MKSQGQKSDHYKVMYYNETSLPWESVTHSRFQYSTHGSKAWILMTQDIIVAFLLQKRKLAAV